MFAGGVGKADLATNRDVTADTMFRIGSITKSFVALSLLKLQEQGKVGLDAKVAEVVPEVKIVNRWDATDPIRIENLLEHTAGFDDMPPAETYDMSGGPKYRSWRHSRGFPSRRSRDGVQELSNPTRIRATGSPATSSRSSPAGRAKTTSRTTSCARSP